MICRDIHEQLVELADTRGDRVIVPPDELADEYRTARDEERYPRSFSKLLIDRDAQDRDAQNETGCVDGKVFLPLTVLVSPCDEEARHPEFRQRKGEENIDGVHDHEGR